MKKYRIIAVVILVCGLAELALGVLSAVVEHQPVVSGLTRNGAVIAVATIAVAIYLWYLGRTHEQRLAQYAGARVERAAGGVESSASPRLGYADLLLAVARRLGSAGYGVAHDVTLPPGDVADLVASRMEFTLPGAPGVPVVQHLLMRHLAVAGAKDFDALFEAGYRYARSAYPGPPLRWKRFMHVIVPCIAVDQLTPELIGTASSRPPKRWMRFEFPVAYDLATGRTYYYDGKTPSLGGMLFPGAQELANLAFDISHPSLAS